MKSMKQVASMLTAAAMTLSAFSFRTFSDDEAAMTAQAANSLYPVQEFRLGIFNTDRNASVDGNAVTSATLNETDTEKWSLNFVSTGVYEIVSSSNGYILTGNGSQVNLAADTDGAAQRWKIEGVQKDYDGYYLYYKVTNNSTGQALTFQPEGNAFTLTGYSGADYQKYKLNLDGLEGFAANCVTSQGEKAGTIGGLLGETVIVTTAKDMETYLNSDKPYTVVVNGNFDMQEMFHTRFRDYKTLVGSYNANQLTDAYFRTNNEWGTAGDEPSDNIVIRNIKFLAKNVEDRKQLNIYSSRQIWIDHCSFDSQLIRDVDEVGKFIWINTPQTNSYDKKDINRSPDYVTISYCTFQNRYWTVAYGTQNSETTRCRTTLMYNWWNNCVRRTPQIGNGTGHIYNNYHSFSGSGASQQIIGGDGSTTVSENCRFEGLNGLEIAGGGSTSNYRDSGSYTGTSKLNFNPSYSTNLQPSQHYGYSLLEAYSTSGTDTKSFCQTYSGCFNSESKLKYITDSDMAGHIKTRYDCPFLEGTDVTDAKQGAVMDTTHKYRFVNVGSGMSLEVANSEAASGANVQQGNTGADGWTLADAGDGYYYIYSELGDGKTFTLDVPYGSADNGTSIGIWTNDESDARKFKFVDNGDGSYQIVTKVSKDASCIGVYGGSKEAGADAVQWTINTSNDQKWRAEIKVDPIDGNLIRNLVIKDTTTYQSWSLDDSAAVGDLVFGDRDVTYTAIPEALLGAEMIVTACDAKNFSNDLAEFQTGADCTVYVALDSRVTNAPAWLADWTKTAETVTNSKDVTFILYAKKVKQGDTVVLGTNGQSSGCVNYTVFAVEAIAVSEAVPGDVNEDGALKISDVILLNRLLAEDTTVSITDQGRINAECDGVEGLSTSDSTAILKYLAGIESLPTA